MSWICGIYDSRPEACKVYPKADQYQPESCGFYFLGDGKRRGRCEEACDAACCKLPRENGEPGGAALPVEAGGMPCRYLVWSEEEVEFGPEEEVPVDGDTRDAPTRPYAD
jgi:hypothetical protein